MGLSSNFSPEPDLPATPVASPVLSEQPTLERYANQVFCETLATSITAPSLDYIHDVVVSPDGERVYFTYSRHQFVNNPEQNFNLVTSRSPFAGQRLSHGDTFVTVGMRPVVP